MKNENAGDKLDTIIAELSNINKRIDSVSANLSDKIDSVNSNLEAKLNEQAETIKNPACSSVRRYWCN